MDTSRKMSLSGSFRPLMALIAVFIFYNGYGQFNPSACCTVSNKPYGQAQAGPTDGRSEFWDPATFLFRKFSSRAEANFYLNLTKYRTGYTPVYIDSAGHTWEYWYRD